MVLPITLLRKSAGAYAVVKKNVFQNVTRNIYLDEFVHQTFMPDFVKCLRDDKENTTSLFALDGFA